MTTGYKKLASGVYAITAPRGTVWAIYRRGVRVQAFTHPANLEAIWKGLPGTVKRQCEVRMEQPGQQ